MGIDLLFYGSQDCGCSRLLACNMIPQLYRPVIDQNHLSLQEYETLKESPAEGVYIYGLYLDGCAWSGRENKLVEPEPKKLYCPLPVLYVTGVQAKVGHGASHVRRNSALNRTSTNKSCDLLTAVIWVKQQLCRVAHSCDAQACLQHFL